MGAGDKKSLKVKITRVPQSTSFLQITLFKIVVESHDKNENVASINSLNTSKYDYVRIRQKIGIGQRWELPMYILVNLNAY